MYQTIMKLISYIQTTKLTKYNPSKVLAPSKLLPKAGGNHLVPSANIKNKSNTSIGSLPKITMKMASMDTSPTVSNGKNNGLLK